MEELAVSSELFSCLTASPINGYLIRLHYTVGKYQPLILTQGFASSIVFSNLCRERRQETILERDPKVYQFKTIRHSNWVSINCLKTASLNNGGPASSFPCSDDPDLTSSLQDGTSFILSRGRRLIYPPNKLYF